MCNRHKRPAPIARVSLPLRRVVLKFGAMQLDTKITLASMVDVSGNGDML